MGLYDDILLVLKNPAARIALAPLLQRINLKLWLSFTEGTKGHRKVRVLQGGIMTTGDTKPPIRPYGDDNTNNDDDAPASGHGSSSLVLETVGEMPTVGPFSPTEGVSLPMVNRGDKI